MRNYSVYLKTKLRLEDLRISGNLLRLLSVNNIDTPSQLQMQYLNNLFYKSEDKYLWNKKNYLIASPNNCGRDTIMFMELFNTFEYARIHNQKKKVLILTVSQEQCNYLYLRIKKFLYPSFKDLKILRINSNLIYYNYMVRYPDNYNKFINSAINNHFSDDMENYPIVISTTRTFFSNFLSTPYPKLKYDPDLIVFDNADELLQYESQFTPTNTILNYYFNNTKETQLLNDLNRSTRNLIFIMTKIPKYINNIIASNYLDKFANLETIQTSLVKYNEEYSDVNNIKHFSIGLSSDEIDNIDIILNDFVRRLSSIYETFDEINCLFYLNYRYNEKELYETWRNLMYNYIDKKVNTESYIKCYNIFMDHQSREKVLYDFRHGNSNLNILITNNLADRKINFGMINLIVNLDFRYNSQLVDRRYFHLDNDGFILSYFDIAQKDNYTNYIVKISETYSNKFMSIKKD